MLERVHSISTSGHKYGLVYPGVGWVVWRTLEALPEELIFRVSYLGGDMPTLALNFSRPGAQVLLQYYQFLRLGREGYTAIQQECQDVAQYIAKGISEIGAFDLWSDGSDIPVFAWQLKPGHTENWNLYHLSDRLRMKGWLVPAYPMPDNMRDLTVQRIVVRNGLSRDLADDLLDDIRTETAWLDALDRPCPPTGRSPGSTTERAMSTDAAAMSSPADRTDRRRRLRREAWGFAVGSLCFLVGAVPFYAEWAGAVGTGVTFFAGSIFFTTAAFIQLSLSGRRPPSGERTAPIGPTGGPPRSSSSAPSAST